MASASITVDKNEVLATYKRFWLIRSNLGMTDSEVADKAGVNRRCLVRWKSGEVLPQTKTLFKIATALGVKVSDFFEGG